MNESEQRDSFERMVRRAYDGGAEFYVREFARELERKPFDRDLLDRFARSIRAGGLLCDVGCGPGQIGAYLAARGASVCGVDLSEEMIRAARRLHPHIDYSQGNMLELDAEEDSLTGIVAFYSLIHLVRADAPRAIAEFARVLEPRGRLLISFHGGTGEVRVEEAFGEPVPLVANLYEIPEMRGHLERAGFEIESCDERAPYSFEYPTRRVYMSARLLCEGRA